MNTANVGSQQALLEGHHDQSSKDQTEAYPVLNNSICSKCYTQYKQWDSFRILLPPSLFFCLPNSSDITHFHLSEGKLPSSLCVNHHPSLLRAQSAVPTARWDTQLKKAKGCSFFLTYLQHQNGSSMDSFCILKKQQSSAAKPGGQRCRGTAWCSGCPREMVMDWTPT